MSENTISATRVSYAKGEIRRADGSLETHFNSSNGDNAVLYQDASGKVTKVKGDILPFLKPFYNVDSLEEL